MSNSSQIGAINSKSKLLLRIEKFEQIQTNRRAGETDDANGSYGFIAYRLT
jgi:hypothetical protein